MSERNDTFFYTSTEDRWNAWSHAAGIVLGMVAGAMFLKRCAGVCDTMAMASVLFYLFGMLNSYLASAMYHAMAPSSPWKSRFRYWDHVAIYWHIAGSYAPVTLVALRSQGHWGVGLLVFVCLCAVAGTFYALGGLKRHSNFETLCYVAMGLSVLAVFGPLLRAVNEQTIGWLVGEGVAYITGAIFYTLHKRRYMHTVFHFFVLLGTFCHVMAVWNMLITCE